MGIFDRFPYSSTHEMNLDFMLGKATEIAESLQEIDTHKEQAEQAATNAAQSAQSAAQAAQAAAGSQTAAGTSASQAAQHKADAEDAADRAEAASDLADEAVEHAQTAAQNASTAADGAIASATAAERRINTLAASLPEDFTELNNKVNKLIENINVEVVAGSLNQTGETSDTRYARAKEFYRINKGETIHYNSTTSLVRTALYFYSAPSYDSIVISTADLDVAANSSGLDYVAPVDGYFKIRMCFIPATTLTEGQIAVLNTLVSYQHIISNEKNNITYNNSSVKTICHRGFISAPENTIIAFKQAKAYGFNICETDIRFTSDGVPVCLHDPTINRTARNSDGTALASTINIADITCEQALTYDFGIYKGSQYAGTRIPTLTEFLDICKKISLSPVIELKIGTEAQITAIYNTVKDYGFSKIVKWLSDTGIYLVYIMNLDDSATLIYSLNIAHPEYIAQFKTPYNIVIAGINRSDITEANLTYFKTNNYPVLGYTYERLEDILNANPYITYFMCSTLVVEKEMLENALYA